MSLQKRRLTHSRQHSRAIQVVKQGAVAGVLTWPEEMVVPVMAESLNLKLQRTRRLLQGLLASMLVVAVRFRYQEQQLVHRRRTFR